MKNQYLFTIGIAMVAILAMSMYSIQPKTASASPALEPSASAMTVQYGRLVFSGDEYNWLAGDERARPTANIRTLINRLEGRPNLNNFTTLLDTIGAQGWQLVFETDDPEGNGKAWVFMQAGVAQ